MNKKDAEKYVKTGVGTDKQTDICFQKRDQRKA
jgi:hypothetical protein